MDPADYCRQIETYLCRKNEGHLIRIVGPAFEQVSGWAAQGVPLAIAFRGIDQYCERYYAKGQRRRPVRIEFCEADILSLFDDWRRAVGVTRADGDDEAPAGKSDSLPAHIDRLISRLTALRATTRMTGMDGALEASVRELDRLRPSARQARGEARSSLIARLDEIDRELLTAAHSGLDDVRLSQLRAAAEEDIAPFAARMPAEARAAAIEVAFERLVRDAAGLPTVRHDP